MDICEELELEKKITDKIRTPPKLLNKIVSKGDKIDIYTIRYCRPDPCLITYTTSINFVSSTPYTIKEVENYVLLKIYPNQVYVYPKDVWSEINNLYLSPMIKGELPLNPGLLLHGPPGTGKTSLMKILAEISGIGVIEVMETDVISKYVGESEKSLQKIFDDAIARQPVMLFFDDADWLLGRRNLGEGEEDESYQKVERGLIDIMLKYLPKIQQEKHRVLVVATINYATKTIDRALLRPERFGSSPLFLPLPDQKALYYYLREMNFKENEAEQISRLIASNGGSFPHVIEYIERKKRGIEYKFSSTEEKGYIRVMPQFIPIIRDEESFDSLLLIANLNKNLFENTNTRIGFVGHLAFFVPLLNELSLYTIGRGAILLNDTRYVSEALLTAEDSKQPLIVNMSTVGVQIADNISINSAAPVFYIISNISWKRGEVPSDIAIASDEDAIIDSTYDMPKLRVFLMDILFSYMGIKHEINDLESLSKVFDRSDVKKESGKEKYRHMISNITVMPLVKQALDIKESRNLDILSKAKRV